MNLNLARPAQSCLKMLQECALSPLSMEPQKVGRADRLCFFYWICLDSKYIHLRKHRLNCKVNLPTLCLDTKSERLQESVLRDFQMYLLGALQFSGTHLALKPLRWLLLRPGLPKSRRRAQETETTRAIDSDTLRDAIQNAFTICVLLYSDIFQLCFYIFCIFKIF